MGGQQPLFFLLEDRGVLAEGFILLVKGGEMGVSSCVAGLVANRRLQELSNSAAWPAPPSALATHSRESRLCLIAIHTVLDST